MFNVTIFLAARSGAGKSNFMRELKRAVKAYMTAVGSDILTTNFTIEALMRARRRQDDAGR